MGVYYSFYKSCKSIVCQLLDLVMQNGDITSNEVLCHEANTPYKHEDTLLVV